MKINQETPLRVLSLFSGIGAFEKALKRLKIPFELVYYCEIDKFASQAYSLIHGIPESKNLGDIVNVDEKKLPDFDLLTYGFPCTSISVAGKQAGIKMECMGCHHIFDLKDMEDYLNLSCPKCKGNNIRSITPSGLVFEALRIIKHKKPKFLIAENVKNLLSKKFKPDFLKLLAILEKLGYKNYYQVLNAKDFGVPQNRERVFIVSIRTDINMDFAFPKGFDNGIRLRDILEEKVDEKYYVKDEIAQKLILDAIQDTGFVGFKRKGMPIEHALALTARDYKGMCNQGINVVKEAIPCLTPTRLHKRQNGRRLKTAGEPMFTLTSQDRHGILEIGMLDIKGNEQIRRVYSPEGISPTLTTMKGGNRQPKILEEPASGQAPASSTVPGNNEAKLKFIGGIPDSKKWLEDGKSLSRNYKQGYRVYDSAGISCSQVAKGGGIGGVTGIYLVQEKTTDSANETLVCCYRIRKLTPLECFRLMGFDDEDYYILKQNKISDSQMYKMAGNSIVVNVLEKILAELFKKSYFWAEAV